MFMLLECSVVSFNLYIVQCTFIFFLCYVLVYLCFVSI